MMISQGYQTTALACQVAQIRADLPDRNNSSHISQAYGSDRTGLCIGSAYGADRAGLCIGSAYGSDRAGLCIGSAYDFHRPGLSISSAYLLAANHKRRLSDKLSLSFGLE
jgi:hypothetical protein